jgi:Ala-tRNA(Pro) deacylase
MLISDLLRARNIPFTRLLHPPVLSAARVAHSIHVGGSQVAKSVLIRTESGFVLAVLPATFRVDLARLAAVTGLSGLSLASEDDVSAVFHDCELGALPPFGHLYGLTTVVDARLGAHAEIVVVGNTRHEGLRLRFRDFEVVEQPTRARFAEVIQPPRCREERRAG